jgi:RimJ/RimL family protein N-acetyltransferase
MKEIRAYRCLKLQEIVSDQFALKTIQDDDIEDVRRWRNDQIDVLRQPEPISSVQQKRYFEQSIWPAMELENPENILLTFFENKKRIGYGGLVHIVWEHRRAEVSFLLDTAISRNVEERARYFSAYLKIIKDFAFNNLALDKLTTETYDIRPDYIQVLEENDFELEGRLRRHVVINEKYIDSVCHAAFRQTGVNQVLNTGTELKVLITSAAAKVSLVNAIKCAGKRMPYTPIIIAGDTNPFAHTKYVADGFMQLPPTVSDNLDTLITLCKTNNIDLVIPTRDGELEFWARNRPTFERRGTAVLVSDPQAIAVSLDKLAFARFGEKSNLPVIPAWENPVGSGPFVVKERYGAGSRSIGLNLSKDDAIAHAAKLLHPVYQPFIEGREISVDAWLDKQYKVKGLVLRERNEVILGESVVTTTFRNPLLESECVKVLESLRLRGPVVLQLIIDQTGCPHIIELNARFGGASTASISAGLDIWYWSLMELSGQSLDPIPFQRSDVEIRQVRVQRDIVLYDPDI